MDHIPVQSRMIRSVRYDPIGKVLEIRFLNGGLYQYLDVPEATYNALMAATSKGTYFRQRIMKVFRTVKVR